MDGVLRFLALFLALFCHVLTAAPNCESPEELQQYQQQCFIDQGVNITLAKVSLEDSPETAKKSLVDALLAQKADLMCTQPTEYQRALECAQGVSYDCMPEQYKAYMPEPKRMPQMVTTLCNNESRVDFECANSKTSALFDCGYRHAGSLSGVTDFQTILCKGYQFNVECLRSELSSCGCSTVRGYEIVARDIMFPSACPQPSLPRVVCDEVNPERFVDNGGNRLIQSVVVVWMLTAAFVAFIGVFIL